MSKGKRPRGLNPGDREPEERRHRKAAIIPGQSALFEDMNPPAPPPPPPPAPKPVKEKKEKAAAPAPPAPAEPEVERKPKSSDWFRMDSKFNGRCDGCKQMTRSGQEIYYNRRERKSRCVPCGESLIAQLQEEEESGPCPYWDDDFAADYPGRWADMRRRP